MTRRDWKAFEEWQEEYESARLPGLTPERSFQIAEALFQHALLLSPQKVRARRRQSMEEMMADPDLRALMRVRRVFEAHARRFAR